MKKQVLSQVSKLKSEDSLVLNQYYKKLKLLKIEDDDPKIELAIKRLKLLAKRLLNKKLASRENLKGALQFELFKQDSSLRVKKSKWARKRGLGFEDTLRDLLNNAFLKFDVKGCFYRNHVSKFEAQPFDLVLFRGAQRPVMFECKASGILILKNGQVKLSSDSRRYSNHRIQLPKIIQFLNRCDTPLFFAFLNDPTRQVYFVKHQLIVKNLDALFTKRIPLSKEEYFVLPLQLDQISKDQIKEFFEFIDRNPQL